VKHDDQGDHDERTGSDDTGGRGKRKRASAAEQRSGDVNAQVEITAEAPVLEQGLSEPVGHEPYPGDEAYPGSMDAPHSDALGGTDAHQNDAPQGDAQARPPWEVKPYQEHDFHEYDFHAVPPFHGEDHPVLEQCEPQRADPVPGETERIRDASRRLAAGEAVEVGAGIYRWTYRKQGGISRSTSVVLPTPPSGCAWSSAQATTRGGRTGRGEGGVSANVSKTASGITVAQVEFSGSGCTALDFLLFAEVLS
jgi:hypothetical protein